MLRAYGSLTGDRHGCVWSRGLGKNYKNMHSSETAAAGALSLLKRLKRPAAAVSELRVFKGGSVLSFSVISAGFNSTASSSSALCRTSEIKSGHIST